MQTDFYIVQWTIIHYCHLILMLELYIWTGAAIQNGFLLLLT